MNGIGTVRANFKGLDVYPAGTSVNVRKTPTTAGVILSVVSAGNKAGSTTGNILNMSDGIWIQLDNGGYVREDVVKTEAAKANPTLNDAKDIITKLVDSDKKVFDILAKINVFIALTKSKGTNTASFDQQFVILSNRLTARQNAIKNSTVLKWEAGLKAATKKLLESNANITTQYNGDAGMFMSGIGALPVAIIVGVIFGAGLAASAYFIFKPKYSESSADLKLSADLENALSKVDPATAAKIKADLEKQIDTAYNQGNTDGTFGNMFTMLKYVAVAGLAYWGITSLSKHSSK